MQQSRVEKRATKVFLQAPAPNCDVTVTLQAREWRSWKDYVDYLSLNCPRCLRGHKTKEKQLSKGKYAPERVACAKRLSLLQIAKNEQLEFILSSKYDCKFLSCTINSTNLLENTVKILLLNFREKNSGGSYLSGNLIFRVFAL